MHIADKIKNHLNENGWKIVENNDGIMAEKIYRGFAEAGSVSNGDRCLTLKLDKIGRWFEIADGWKWKSIDLRNHWENEPEDVLDQLIKLVK